MIIKVCGMREPENIRQVIEAGVNWIGFIFYEQSPRKVTSMENIASITSSNFPLKKVGVFVNVSTEEMMEKANEFQLDYLQLHGDESPEICHTLQKRGFSLIKAFRIASDKDLQNTSVYEDRVDYFLFDTQCDSYGGSGKQFDWSILSAYKGNTPFILSGGINPDSAEVINHFTHPCFAGIDLNSGFETKPGYKDVEKLKQFLSCLTPGL